MCARKYVCACVRILHGVQILHAVCGAVHRILHAGGGGKGLQGGEGRDCMQYAVHLCASLQTHGGREGGKERESACVRACVRVRARVREIQRQED